MLVLSRKQGEQIRIGDNVVVTVHRLSGNRVSLGIEAPADCKIMRGELRALLQEAVGGGELAATKHVGENRIAQIFEKSMRSAK